jgi:hypothetical protein
MTVISLTELGDAGEIDADSGWPVRADWGDSAAGGGAAPVMIGAGSADMADTPVRRRRVADIGRMGADLQKDGRPLGTTGGVRLRVEPLRRSLR